MAIFNDVSEVDRASGYTKPFEKTKGARKFGLAILGYNADGTKNTFGKYFGHGNVLLDHYAPKALAQGDSKQVINANESSSWGEQTGSAEVASSFVGGGAGSAAGAGKNASGGGQMGSVVGQGGNMASAAGVGSNREKVTSMFNQQNKEQTVADLNSRIDESSYTNAPDNSLGIDNKGGVTNSLGDGVGENGLPDESSYTSLEGEQGVDDGSGQGGSAKNVMGGINKSIPILGSIAKTYQSKLQAADDSEKEKKRILRKSILSPGSQNYL